MSEVASFMQHLKKVAKNLKIDSMELNLIIKLLALEDGMRN